ncbi:MAG: RNA-directed DNA polymerase [Spirochaetes bacterium]|nr:RNA-directed DNA polymerase [Spirochaetota bacterium]
MFNVFRNILKKREVSVPKTFITKEDVMRLPIETAAIRVSKITYNSLIFDPVGYEEYFWFCENHRTELIKLIALKYNPIRQITYNMPKRSFTFRPVGYLNPIDSIMYQSIVDLIIKYKRKKFSNNVYSNIINDIKMSDVFHEPVIHWIEMRNNLRHQNNKGNNYYFNSDISGFFENIKIKKLMTLVDFYVGKKETKYLEQLSIMLEKWHFANSQGLIQPHNASAILAKIYLSRVDSEFCHYGKRYSRYVDEFHILSDNRTEILRSSITLSNQLRDLGLNLNSSKSEYLENDEILSAIDGEQDFYQHVNYTSNILHDDSKSIELVESKFIEFINLSKSEFKINWKIYRYCIRKFSKTNNPIAISYVLEILTTSFDQLVDNLQYLSKFINNHPASEEIIATVFGYIMNMDTNIYNWVQLWLLALIYHVENSTYLDFKYIFELLNNRNTDPLSRSMAYLIYAKHHSDHDLIFLIDHYNREPYLVIKRAILCGISKLPDTIKNKIYEINVNESIDIIVLKKYLRSNSYKFISVLNK